MKFKTRSWHHSTMQKVCENLKFSPICFKMSCCWEKASNLSKSLGYLGFSVSMATKMFGQVGYELSNSRVQN
jgi:glucan biosynthesis protein